MQFFAETSHFAIEFSKYEQPKALKTLRLKGGEEREEILSCFSAFRFIVSRSGRSKVACSTQSPSGYSRWYFVYKWKAQMLG